MAPESYKKTHPHISFEFNVRKLPAKALELLGEAYVRCDVLKRHLAILGPLGDEIEQTYLSKGIQATTAIEGGNLTQEEVAKLISEDPTAEVSNQYFESRPIDKSEQMAKNIQEVYRAIGQEDFRLSLVWLCKVNGLVLKDLPVENEKVVPGKIRRHSVTVGRHKPVDPYDCEELLAKMFDWFNGRAFCSGKTPAQQFRDTILKAILAHLYILYIHPFGDGNGRSARAIEVQILTSGGVPSPATHLFSNHYNHTREKYYEQLAMSRHQKDKEIPQPYDFILYALEGFVEGLKEQLDLIFMKQKPINRRQAWRSLVEDRYKNSESDIAKRQMKVAFALLLDEPTPISKIRSLSPRVAELYWNKTDKTITRDINSLLEKGLIEQVGESSVQPKQSLFENKI